MKLAFRISKFFSNLFTVKLRQMKAPVGWVCLVVFPITYVLSGALASPLLAIYIASLYTCGLAGLLIMFNSRLMKPYESFWSDKRVLDLFVGGFFVFMSYLMLEASYWILPMFSHIGGS